MGQQVLRWPHLSLAWQFTIVSSAVIIAGMLAFGAYLSNKIEESHKHDAGAAAALFVDSFIAPHVLGHPTHSPLSDERVEAIERVMNRGLVQSRVVSIKIWGPEGHVLYSSNPVMIGQQFAVESDLRHALAGHVSAEFDNLQGAESAWERASGLPLMEVYAPIRDETGQVVAVAEFYENGLDLRRKILEARFEGWIITAAVSVGMILSLFWVVVRGSNTIERQRQDVARRIKQLCSLLRQNMELRRRVEQASRRATEETECFLRRIAADLHDGPAQLISLALLRLDDLEADCPNRSNPRFGDDMAVIRGTLQEAMTDVRNLCAGLSMPEIDALSLREALAATIRHHERRTRTDVESEIEALPDELPRFLKICACRFVQEGLTNAFRHAGGKDQRVRARVVGETIVVEVEDGGPGLSDCAGGSDRPRLGLTGMWDRIESLGGQLDVVSRPGEGVLLRARLPLLEGGKT